ARPVAQSRNAILFITVMPFVSRGPAQPSQPRCFLMLHSLEHIRDHQNSLADTPALASCQAPQLGRPRFAAKEVCRHRRSPKHGTLLYKLYNIWRSPEAGIISRLLKFYPVSRAEDSRFAVPAMRGCPHLTCLIYIAFRQHPRPTGHANKIFCGNFPVQGSARHVAPHDITPARLPLAALLDHSLRLRLDQIEHRVAGDPDEAMRLEQFLDFLA